MDASQSPQATSTSTFRCDQCDKPFSGQYELSRHCNEAKAHQPALQCLFPGCPAAYQRHARTKEHFWDQHAKQLGRFTISEPTNSTHNFRAVSVLEAQERNRQMMDIQATQQQGSLRWRIYRQLSDYEIEPSDDYDSLSAGPRYTFGYLNTGSEQPLMSNNTSLPSNATYAPYSRPHQQMLSYYPTQIQQGSYQVSMSQGGTSTIASLPPYSNNFFGLMGPTPTSPFPVSAGHPLSYYQDQPTYGAGTHNFVPSMGIQGSAPVEESAQSFYNRTMNGVEGSMNAQGPGDKNCRQDWMG
ncbi:hypothetical protein G7Y89_g10262 [Cudoniella acicularis]|uniref:C2H2-type domain-containing protein n=1 Tax=Cudoniella acicularis TaxID=354080 RepID=A0A8H4RFE6_9HELO|nr:hypothetical protein G7Y89_g10262 [Cudoniella acicularis]